MSAPLLLVLAPLRLEALALGPGRSSICGGTRLVVERTGMGLVKAEAAAARWAAHYQGQPAEARPVAVVLAGLGGALADGLATGDLVVADSLLRADGTEVPAPPGMSSGAAELAAQLARQGLPARVGAVVSTDHIVVGEERQQLSRSGASVVDMESAAVAGAPWQVPLAVVRAVSDSPGHELFSPAGALGVAKALRSLRAARPALAAWARTFENANMEVH